MAISQFARACSHYDVIVKSYITVMVGIPIWNQWEEDVHAL